MYVICLELIKDCFFRFTVLYDKAVVVARLSGYLLQQLDNARLVADVNRVMYEQRNLVNCHFRKRQVILKNIEIRVRLGDAGTLLMYQSLCFVSRQNPYRVGAK